MTDNHAFIGFVLIIEYKLLRWKIISYYRMATTKIINKFQEVNTSFGYHDRHGDFSYWNTANEKAEFYHNEGKTYWRKLRYVPLIFFMFH